MILSNATTSKRELDYIIQYARPDSSTNSPYAVAAAYTSSIQAKIYALMLDYYRIVEADVTPQEAIIKGCILTAANVIESLVGVVVFPKAADIFFNRFPYYNYQLALPLGPLQYNGSNATLTYTLVPESAYANELKFSILGDTDSAAECRLYHDGTIPQITLKSGQVWPVPLYSESYPVKVSGLFGVLNATFCGANTKEVVFNTYSQLLTTLFQVALHYFENRTPTVTGLSVAEVPYTLQLLINQLKR